MCSFDEEQKTKIPSEPKTILKLKEEIIMVSQAKANTHLSALCGKAAITQASSVYLGFCASEPGATNGAITDEPTAASYSRKLVGGSSAPTQYFGVPSGGVVTNSSEIQMATAREDMGMQYYWFLSESISGNAYLWGKLYASDGTEGIEVKAETVPVFYEGQLKASIDVALS